MPVHDGLTYWLSIRVALPYLHTHPSLREGRVRGGANKNNIAAYIKCIIK
jgi:hypothetical protein